MQPRRDFGLTLALCLAAACGGGGGGGSSFGSGGETVFGAVQLLEHAPDDGAVQIATDARIDLRFDATMALDTFGDEDTWLRVEGSTTNVPGTFSRGNGGRVSFTPSSPLLAETDYVMQLSGLTSDETGRILDVTRTFTFRTVDTVPPSIVSLDVVAGATGQSRTRTFTVTTSERIAADSVTDASFYLRDQFGQRYSATRTVAGNTLTLDPDADLPGDRLFTLVLGTTITDRAGNRLAASSTTSFRTAPDTAPPSVVSAWPTLFATGISPLVQPTFTFTESMDPATVEAASLLFQDEFGNVVPFAIDSTRDQRTLRVRPLQRLVDSRRYTLAFLLGGAAATDVSGNSLAATQAQTFTTGTDSTPPTVVASLPSDGDTRFPGGAELLVTCSETLDPAWVNDTNVELTVDGSVWSAVVDRPTTTTVRVQPVLELPPATACTLRLRGGQTGLHDLAGNVLAGDVQIPFTTSTDTETPQASLAPNDGAANVAPGSRVVVVFDAPMDPATLREDTVLVTDDVGTPLPGSRTLTGGDRILTFTPTVPFANLTYYRTRVVGGSSGARRLSGNWFPTDRTARFRTGTTPDAQAPSVAATLNGIATSRNASLVLPPSGFTIDVTTSDAGQWIDASSFEVSLSGSAPGPDPATLLAVGTLGYGTLNVTVPAGTPLADGAWTLTVRVRDLTGNLGTSSPLSFTVATPGGDLTPFERTQIVWVRTDLDRDGNGRTDFEDDMLRLGFGTLGDAAGTNAFVRNLVLDGILAQANRLYGRGARGEPLDSGSVGLRFARRQPIGLPHMQMALGGLDPEGDRSRAYGAESTGVLGRAYFDYRNGNAAERNTSNSPGLGVFPAEMWLYQTRIHLQVWPSFQTVFAQRFRPLCPDMGGTPAGAHALDPVVLSPTFDYANATTQQRARWQTVMDAADDWAVVIGIILAHEVGHSVGLVAPGAAPTGLFGDSSLHDTYASAAEVMAASVGYEAMTSLDYQFRDIDLAYLRHRVLLR
ncbi:MAG: Ig-like domain-containing protein [Planctomycetota bacterium]